MPNPSPSTKEPSSITKNCVYAVLCGVVVLLIGIIICTACMYTNRPVYQTTYKRRRRCPTRANRGVVEGYTPRDLKTIQYTGSYHAFQGLWHRLEGGFKGDRLHYQGSSVHHLREPYSGTVWLHEGGNLAIYDQYIYTNPQSGKKVYVWSIGEWHPKHGGVVSTARNAYAILDVDAIPTEYQMPLDNLITLAKTHGGSGWGGVDAQEHNGAFVAVYPNQPTNQQQSQATATNQPTNQQQFQATATQLTPTSDTLRWVGSDQRLQGLWQWQKDALWYNDDRKLALVGDTLFAEPRWRVQAWSPEWEQLGINMTAGGGVLIPADDITGGTDAQSVRIGDGRFESVTHHEAELPQMVETTTQNTFVSDFTAPTVRPRILGDSASVRKRVDMKNRFGELLSDKLGGIRNTRT